MGGLETQAEGGGLTGVQVGAGGGCIVSASRDEMESGEQNRTIEGRGFGRGSRGIDVSFRGEVGGAIGTKS